MIAYSRFCLPCTHKSELKALRQFAAENKLDLEIRQVTYDKQWQKEAANLSKHHKVKYPFIHHDGKAVEITGDFETLLHKQNDGNEDEQTSTGS